MPVTIHSLLIATGMFPQTASQPDATRSAKPSWSIESSPTSAIRTQLKDAEVGRKDLALRNVQRSANEAQVTIPFRVTRTPSKPPPLRNRSVTHLLRGSIIAR